MYDLIGEYEESLSLTRKMKRRVEEKIFELQSTIANEDIPFEERAAASDQLILEQQDKSIISGMESDLVFAIDWMLTSRRPGNRRGIERRSLFQRTKLIDPMVLQSFYSGEPDEYFKVTQNQENDDDHLNVEKALSVLTKREREVFELCRAKELSYGDIGKQLNIARQVVHKTIVRAERKLDEYITSQKGAE